MPGLSPTLANIAPDAPLPDGLNVADVEALRAAARERRALRIRVAREDASHFCRYVLRDERDGKRIKQAPMHKRWHEILDQHDRVIFWSHVEGGKSTQLAVGRVLWELGRNPNLRVAVISNTSDMARKITRQIGQYIEKSAELHDVFPHLVPTDDPNLTWKAQSLTIKRPVTTRDPSVQAAGVHGNIQGSRIDYLVIDDVLDYENTRTPGPREDLFGWIKSIVIPRLTEHARVIIVGNAWHPDDLMHRLERDPHYKAFRFPVIDEGGVLTWPERWPIERVERAKLEYGPLEYARQLLCQARDDTSARFKKEWVDLCTRAGRGKELLENVDAYLAELAAHGDLSAEEYDRIAQNVEALEAVERLAQPLQSIHGVAGVFTGVDLAVQRGDSNDLTALFTIGVNRRGVRRVLDVRSGRWTGPEIVDQIIDVHRLFGSIVVVENNAAQDYMLQFVRHQTAVPVVPFTTGRNKAHPEFGVESLATELANGKWVIPCEYDEATKRETLNPELTEWVKELLFYDPREHVGDRVMASWFAREGARKYWDSSAHAGTSVGVRAF